MTWGNAGEEGGALLIENSTVLVPIRDQAQRAFHDWLKRPEILDSLAEVLAPFGLDPRDNVSRPDLMRIVKVGEGNILDPLEPR
ncbi:hypothetical protein SEA_RASPUTIA_51 [Microbacterium phage Rasputia]|nr:hypothetical protein SEA_RASPUTIA_51 [Microbacterium phage Rasputia]